MSYKNNITKKNENKKTIQMLTETAETIADRGRKILDHAENTMLFCHIMPGTKGEAHKDMLLLKVEDMLRLAKLHDLASRRYINAVEKLVNGAPEVKVLSDVIAYSAFFKDQLVSEERDSMRILSILREVNNSQSGIT